MHLLRNEKLRFWRLPVAHNGHTFFTLSDAQTLKATVVELPASVLELHPRSPSIGYWRALSDFERILPADPLNREWRATLDGFHETGHRGSNQVIAVIDTGYDTDHPLLRRVTDAQKCVDLTGEGIADRNGHGTMVSLVASACAPAARLIHIKAFDSAGHCPGRSPPDVEKLLSEALAIAGQNGATLINFSAGVKRIARQYPDLSHAKSGHCSCLICRTAKDLAISKSVSIFAAAGNEGRSNRDYGAEWYCPSNAECVTPVIGLQQGSPIYESLFVKTAGIGTVGVFPFEPSNARLSPFAWVGRLWLYWRGGTRHGSSVATPIVTGTAAVVREMFANCGVLNPMEGRPGRLECVTFFEGNAVANEEGEAISGSLFKLQDLFANYGHDDQQRTRGLSNFAILSLKADALMASEKYEDALGMYRLLARIGPAMTGGGRYNEALFTNSVGVCLMRLNMPEAALGDLRKAAQICDQHAGSAEFDTLRGIISENIALADTLYKRDLQSMLLAFRRVDFGDASNSETE